VSSLPLTNTRPRIAIAGATGRIGSVLTGGLSAEAVDVVALGRSPDAAKFPAGVTVASIDFDDPTSLERALQGANRLFVAHGTSARQVFNEIALIDAAVAAGVDHIVKVSVLGPPSRLHPFDWHMTAEAHLASQSVGYTVLRPSPFVDILNRAAAQVTAGSWSGAAGHGRANFIDTRDVADVARVALLDSSAVSFQRAFHLTGPRAWSMQEIAAELSLLLGRRVTYGERSPEEQRSALVDAGTSEFVAELLLGLDQVFRESALAETTTTVQELTGHPPRTLPQWLQENLALFSAD